MEEGIDRQGKHTFWRNYVSKLEKKKERKGIFMLQAPVVILQCTSPGKDNDQSSLLRVV
jgi:hypothetical protein